MLAQPLMLIEREQLNNSIVSDSGTIIIVEPNPNGHRMVYCRLITESAIEDLKSIVLATSSETLDSDEFTAQMSHLADNISTINLGPLKPGPANWQYQSLLLRQIDSIAASYPMARLVVLEGDKFVIPLAMYRKSFRRSLTVLVMRAPATRLSFRLSFVNDLLKRIGISVCRMRGVNVKVLAPALRATPPYSFRGYAAVPDPVDIHSTPTSIELYRSEMKLDASRIWVGVFGNITSRKNLDLVADAIVKCGAEKYGLLVAGKISPDERSRCAPSLQRLNEAGGSLIFDSRLLSDSELDSAIASVSITAIAHSSEGPSGILGKAVASGVAVAAAGAMSLKEDVDRLGAGAWSPLSADAFAVALQTARVTPRAKRTGLANGRDFALALLSAPTSTQ